jgi:hypothetical protein
MSLQTSSADVEACLKAVLSCNVGADCSESSPQTVEDRLALIDEAMYGNLTQLAFAAGRLQKEISLRTSAAVASTYVPAPGENISTS